MKPYLIDANCFIQANNFWYGIDFCPGFWNWIDRLNRSGQIFSIDKIKDELVNYGDELSEWAKARDHSFFLPVDAKVASRYAQIVTWAQSSDFKQAGIDEFLSGADPWLVAYAATYGYTVVSHEVFNSNEKRRIKIQAPCNQFGVACADLWSVLRKLGIKLVTKESSDE